MAGCETCKDQAQIILPGDLPIPVMVGDDNQDIVTLVGQDIRWRIRLNYCRYIVGEIDKEEHDKNKAQLEALLVLD